MKYYLINNKIMKGGEMPTLQTIPKFTLLDEEIIIWKTSLQPCEISESELEKVKNKVYTFNNCHADNPIDVTDIISDNNGVITFKEKLVDINLDVKDYILNKYPHLKREGKNPIIDFELLDLCNFIDEYTNAKVEEFKIKQAKFLIENFSNKQVDGEIEAVKQKFFKEFGSQSFRGYPLEQCHLIWNFFKPHLK